MIDTLLKYKDKAAATPILVEPKQCHCEERSDEATSKRRVSLQKGNYALMTMHRPHNVDIKENLLKILRAIQEIQSKIQIVFPMHPRTRSRIEEFQLSEKLSDMENLIVIEPVGYLRFFNLMMNAQFVLTDSGGMQQETTVLRIPCLTLRENTERPETIDEGTNTLVGNDTQRIIEESFKNLKGQGKTGSYPELWDGRTAERIVKIINLLEV